MKLIRIGHDSKCDIVLHDETVSGLHAEMTLLNDGELNDGDIILVDMDSKNGTFVDNVRIQPGKEVKIHRGDRIKFATHNFDANDWSRVPNPYRNSEKYKQIINIGKDYKNDIQLTNSFCSRYHAELRITKDKKAMLMDTGSKNGTKVNGVAIKPGQEKRIKRGDNIICANEDITDVIKQYIPNKWRIIKIVAAVAACVAILAVTGYWIYKNIYSDKDYDKELVAAMEKDGQAVLNPATVYVRSYFHYIVKIEDCPVSSDIWDGEMKMNILGDKGFLMGTAFFVDREGRMVTNRHIAKPWDKAYYSMFGKDIDKMLKQQINLFVNTILALLPKYASGEYSKSLLYSYGYGNYIQYMDFIIKDAIKKQQSGQGNASLNLTNSIDMLKTKCRYTIDGKMDYITVGYAGRNYTHLDEFERCDVLGDSENEDIDLAILQLNKKKTPDDVKFIYDIKYVRGGDNEIKPLEDNLYTIGYPHGELWGLDDKAKSLEPTLRATKCSKKPSRYTFDIQESSQGGASGSPVFDDKGRLTGVLCTGYSGGSTQAVLGKYIKELYDKVK